MPYFLERSFDHSQKNFPEGMNISMLNDSKRLVEYEAYFKSHARDKVILDVGAGLGLIGLKALNCGAAHVYFVEQNQETAKYLRQLVAAHPRAQNTTVIEQDFHTTKKDLFKLEPDILVCELWGPHLWNEGLIPTALHAQTLFPNIQMVPATYHSIFNIVKIDKSEKQIWPQESITGVDLTEIYKNIYKTHLIHASGVKYENLSEGIECFSLNKDGFKAQFSTEIEESLADVFFHLAHNMIWPDGHVRTYRETFFYVPEIKKGQHLHLGLNENFLPTFVVE